MSSQNETSSAHTGDLFSRGFVAGEDRVERDFGGFVDAAADLRFVVLVDVDLDFLTSEEDDFVQIQSRQIRLTWGKCLRLI